MREIVSTISSKGQITIPADVRRHLGVGASDKVTFVIGGDGRVELRPVRYTLESVLGSVKPLPDESPDLDREIDEAMAAEAERIVARLRRP